MSKRIKVTKSKNSESFYIIDDFTDPKTRKHSTFIVERLGSLSSLKSKYDTDSREVVLDNLKQYVYKLREQDKENKAIVSINFTPSQLIPLDDERLYNLGYMYFKNILFSLGIKDICQQITDRHKFQFDLTSIVSDLVNTRIIYPGSKRSSFKDAHHFLDVPQYQLEDVYRSLPVLADERYFVEKELYLNSSSMFERNNSVLFYDCTNFYFEIEEENDFLKYGKSKENRPNPIVQYGLFMDANVLPIADMTFEGNKNEQFSLRELEKQIEKDFQFSRFIVCADAGLNGWENKVYNDKKAHGAYIVTQPIKKLKKKLKDWATNPEGWRLLGHNKVFNIDEVDDAIVIDGVEYRTDTLIFYKDRWEKDTKKTEQSKQKYTLEEHIIVSFSTKYRKYQRRIRNKKLERARRLLKNPGKLDTKNPRDPRYYIQRMDTTQHGEVAEETAYSIDESKILDDMKYDGLYAVATDLEDSDISMIIKANKQRWEIEESFEIMKSEFKTRPVYVKKDDAINGHLLTCFIALLIYRILEKEFLKEKYTCQEIIDTLRALNLTHIGGSNYIPSFKRTKLVDELVQIFGFQPSRELITQKNLKKFSRVVNSRKSTKLNE